MLEPKGSPYSGILECPCNSRYGGDPIFYPEAKTKLITHKYYLRMHCHTNTLKVYGR